MADYGVVLVTVGSQNEAQQIGQALVESRLAACVSLMPIQSIYSWQGELHQAEEWQLVIKTDLSQFEALTAKVHTLHSYEVPEIVAVPILIGDQPYLNWIAAQVQP